MSLNSERKDAQSGNATSLVIFLHGFGADARDLIGLADPLAPHLPDTTFLSVNAPDRCAVNPSGYQWFPIPWIDGSSEVEAGIAMAASVDKLDTWLTATLANEQIAPGRTALVGFSQGTMMSLHVGPRREESLAGIVGFSGRLLNPEALKADIRTRPPVLLVHGDRDDVVPYSSMQEAQSGLKEAGLEAETFTSQGTAHGIAPDGLTIALQRLQSWLS